MNAKLLAAALASAAIAIPLAASAHHGWAGQEDKVTVLEGTIQAVRYTMPHGSIQIIAPDQARWTVTLAPIYRMSSRGLTEDKLKVGEKVRIEGNRSLDKSRMELKAAKITIGGKTTDLMA